MNVLHALPWWLERDPKLSLVGSLPLFHRVGRSRLRRLAGSLDEVCFSAGDALMRRGAPQHCFYVVVDGIVGIREAERSWTVGSGHWFGHEAMLWRGPAACTAVAQTDGRALVMSHAQFRALKSKPDLLSRPTGDLVFM